MSPRRHRSPGRGGSTRAGALIGTSGEQTSLFLAPPLIIEEDSALRLLEALDSGLAVADAEL